MLEHGQVRYCGVHLLHHLSNRIVKENGETAYERL